MGGSMGGMFFFFFLGGGWDGKFSTKSRMMICVFSWNLISEERMYSPGRWRLKRRTH